MQLNYRGPGGGIDNAAWTSGTVLFVQNNAIPPDRCIKCNSTDDVRMKRRNFTWVPQWVFVFFLCGLLPLLIAYLLTQKKCAFTFGMCRQCRGKKQLVAIIALSLLGLAGLFVALAVMMDNGVFAIPVPFLVLGSLIYLAIAMPILRPRRIEKNGVGEFTGAGPAFLASLVQRV
ncbi:MAG TPA: hypothetical protein VHM90_06265 [Phycisphaerae bacterium]|nr:hypothetical protein [Phycisphaerae bacterium]